MTSETETLVSGIERLIGNAPALHELDDGETARLKIGYMKSKLRDTEGVTISFHFGTGTSETVESVAEVVEPLLDKRRFKVSEGQPKYKQVKDWDVGWVEIDRAGEIVNYEIETQYLKPSEQ